MICRYNKSLARQMKLFIPYPETCSSHVVAFAPGSNCDRTYTHDLPGQIVNGKLSIRGLSEGPRIIIKPVVEFAFHGKFNRHPRLGHRRQNREIKVKDG